MLSDVIAALATVPGRSALAVLRVSGPGAFDLVARVLHPFQPDPPRVARRAQVRGTGAESALGDALYVAYHAPASFTGEPLVEISTYGGLLVPAETLAALLGAGARPAAPGEFTRRALQHGKVDLLQAEAIDDLIGATTTAQRRTAVHQLDRGLSGRIDGLRAAVLELEALVSYEIDFPEEDDGPVPESRLRRAVERVTTDMTALLATAAEGERLREGALAVVAGQPNVGKSSLFNALLGSERAIVTDVPGTTRDAIEAGVSCGGYPFRLVDTAGLRASDETVERLGIEVSRRFLQAADVVVVCAEAGRPLTAAERDFLRDITAPVVLVRTKADLCAGDADDLAVSARTGAGLAELRDRLAATAFSAMTARADLLPAVTRARHRVALTRALDEVRAFADARTAGADTIAAATHLRSAVLHLEDLIGVVSTEEVLDRVFGDFCIGK